MGSLSATLLASALIYAKNRFTEPASTLGGSAVAVTALATLDPQSPAFWGLLLISLLQILLPDRWKFWRRPKVAEAIEQFSEAVSGAERK